MAYLRKRPKSVKWVACFFGLEGERIQRSTGTTNRKLALRMAIEWEQAAKDARAKVLTTDRARGFLNRLLASSGQTLLDALSFRQFADQWLETKRTERSAGTAERYKGLVTEFIKTLDSRADLPIAGITAMDVEAYKLARLNSKLALATVAVEMKALRALFAAAHRKGLTERNVAAAVDLPEAGATVRVDFSPEEIDAILNAARGSEWETATMLGYFCGMRLGDACRRRWSEVDLKAQTITWTPEKTARKGKSMTLPLHPQLAEHLKATAGSNKLQGFLTPRLAKGKPSGRSGLSQQFTRLMMKAGVKFDIHEADDKGAGRARASKSFHSLRHSLNSQLLIAGVDEAVRVQVSGHSDARTNRRYSHVRGESFRTALNKLPGKPNGPKT